MVDCNEDEMAEVLEGKKESKLKKTLTNSEILSQSVLFSMVGTETTSTTLTNVSYSLAMNPEVQDKLIQEIDTVLANHVIILSRNLVHLSFKIYILYCLRMEKSISTA